MSTYSGIWCVLGAYTHVHTGVCTHWYTDMLPFGCPLRSMHTEVCVYSDIFSTYFDACTQIHAWRHAYTEKNTQI